MKRSFFSPCRCKEIHVIQSNARKNQCKTCIHHTNAKKEYVILIHMWSNNNSSEMWNTVCLYSAQCCYALPVWKEKVSKAKRGESIRMNVCCCHLALDVNVFVIMNCEIECEMWNAKCLFPSFTFDLLHFSANKRAKKRLSEENVEKKNKNHPIHELTEISVYLVRCSH